MCWCSKCLNLVLVDHTWLLSATNTEHQDFSTNHIHPLWSSSSVCVTGNVIVSVFQTQMCSRCLKNKDKIIYCNSTCVFPLCATNDQINQFHLSGYSLRFLGSLQIFTWQHLCRKGVTWKVKCPFKLVRCYQLCPFHVNLQVKPRVNSARW